MGISFFRTLILYVFVIFAMRVMGKRQVGEMQPSELVITILLSELISIPMQNSSIPLLNGVIPIFLLIAFEIISSYAASKNITFKKLLVGTPTVLIENGVINQKNLDKVRCSISELTEELRLKGALGIDEVNIAIMETNGKLSVFLKPGLQPATKDDMEVQYDTKDIPVPIIVSGNLLKKNMERLNLDRYKLNRILRKNKVDDIKDVLICYGYPGGTHYLIKRERI